MVEKYAADDEQQFHGIGKRLQANVQVYLRNRSVKSREEIQASVDWCVKIFERAKRGDCEGMFRWHWVLIDSLEIFCDIMQHPHFGPKKTLKWMEENHPKSFKCYKKALQNLRMDCLGEWVGHIKNISEIMGVK